MKARGVNTCHDGVAGWVGEHSKLKTEGVNVQAQEGIQAVVDYKAELYYGECVSPEG